MIVRTVEDLKTHGSYREKPGVWSSARYLLRRDGMGLTLTETTVAAGSSQTMQYKNHVEANLIIEGEGDVTDLATGRVHRLKTGHDVRPRPARPAPHRCDYRHAAGVRVLSSAGGAGDARRGWFVSDAGGLK